MRGEGCAEGGLATREDDWKADTAVAVAARDRATTAKPRRRGTSNSISSERMGGRAAVNGVALVKATHHAGMLVWSHGRLVDWSVD